MQKKSFDKKGAIELSMTTIIVIIIGITLLSLGLIWVRTTFKNVEDLSKKAFEKADGAISDIFKEPDKIISVSPNSIELQQDSVQTVQFYISNFESDVLNVKAKARSSSKFITCRFADTLNVDSKDYKLASGKQVEVALIVEEKGGPLGVSTCNVDVPSLTGDNSDSLVIKVVKKE